MTREYVEERVIDIVCDLMGYREDEIDLSKDIEVDLGADSLDEVELIMDLEEEFDIEITDEEAEATGKTIDDIVAFVLNKVN